MRRVWIHLDDLAIIVDFERPLHSFVCAQNFRFIYSSSHSALVEVYWNLLTQDFGCLIWPVLISFTVSIGKNQSLFMDQVSGVKLLLHQISSSNIRGHWQCLVVLCFLSSRSPAKAAYKVNLRTRILKKKFHLGALALILIKILKSLLFMLIICNYSLFIYLEIFSIDFI